MTFATSDAFLESVIRHPLFAPLIPTPPIADINNATLPPETAHLYPMLTLLDAQTTTPALRTINVPLEFALERRSFALPPINATMPPVSSEPALPLSSMDLLAMLTTTFALLETFALEEFAFLESIPYATPPDNARELHVTPRPDLARLSSFLTVPTRLAMMETSALTKMFAAKETARVLRTLLLLMLLNVDSFP